MKTILRHILFWLPGVGIIFSALDNKLEFKTDNKFVIIGLAGLWFLVQGGAVVIVKWIVQKI